MTYALTPTFVAARNAAQDAQAANVAAARRDLAAARRDLANATARAVARRSERRRTSSAIEAAVRAIFEDR